MTDFIGSLPTVRRAIAQVAATSATVLVLGESGTGKELVARAIHDQSRRVRGSFVPVNSGALVPGLVASELFGHEIGAYTGAVSRRAGVFERAHGGTLFLDEVGELAPDAQVGLLRVLEERVVSRLGCNGDGIRVDVRLIAATNRSLGDDVRGGRFREDLFYRLNVFPIELPPLRERREDIPVLAAHFLARFARLHERPARVIPPSILQALEVHDWRGNVRELQNIMERAVLVSDEPELHVDLAWFVGATHAESARTWAEQERARILVALRAAAGRIYGPGGAAQRLGLKPTTLYGKMRKHGLKRDADWQ